MAHDHRSHWEHRLDRLDDDPDRRLALPRCSSAP